MKIEEEMKDYIVTEKDDDRMRTIKEVLLSFKPMEQRIWLTYMEEGSYAGAARHFNVSPPTMASYIRALRQKFIDKLEDQEIKTMIMLDDDRNN